MPHCRLDGVLLTILTAVLIDRAGRKPLMVTSFAGMAVCLGVMSAVLMVKSERGRPAGLCLAAQALSTRSRQRCPWHWGLGHHAW